MKFSQRLFRYLIGVFIGLLMVVYFFGDRDWLGWTPEQRVLFKIRDTYQPPSEKVNCLLDCYEIPRDYVDSTLVYGDVIFKDSKTHIEPRIYKINSGKDYGEFSMFFESGEEEGRLIDVIAGEEKDCGC